MRVPLDTPVIQVAGIRDRAEAALLQDCGIHYLGFPLRLPVSREDLTDTYAPETGAAGATGRTHDWAVSRRLVELSPRPVILAGGLTPANVRQAIAAVRAAAVDVHTGVEDASGRKDRAKVREFVAEARAAFAEY